MQIQRPIHPRYSRRRVATVVNFGMALLLSAALAAPALAGGWGGGYRYGHGGHYGGYYGHHGGDDEAAALLAGLVIGGLFGWLISEDRHYHRSHAYHDPYARYDHYYPPRYRTYSAAPPRYREYVVVERRPEPAVARDDAEFARGDCRMTREYQTTVEIDGEQHEAYGTRCLTADGSWVLGRPKLVPEFPNQ